MKSKLLVALMLVLAATVMVGAAAQPAVAITFGQPDGTLHPNVGALVAAVPAGPGPNGFTYDGGPVAVSSGTLIAPRVFLIAGHSVEILHGYGIKDDEVWVTFDSPFVRGTSTLIPGTMHANPGFRWIGSNANDVAVITFDEDVTGIPPATLPTAGQLDRLAVKNGLKDQTFTVVGYGMQETTVGGGPPVFGQCGERRFTTSGFNALTPAKLNLSANSALGYGGSGMFDSGGPNFLGDSNVIAATTVGGDPLCRALQIACRMDTPEARAYLEHYVPLP